MTHPGFFIVLEGPEGAGKSTLAAGLVRRLRDLGREPLLVREPGGTPLAEAIRGALLDPALAHDGPTELLYFATARADLVSRVIRPALLAGKVVISDRFTLSTEAYQIGGRGVRPELVRDVNLIATGGLQPDLTLVLDLPADEGARRQAMAGKAADRMEREDDAFHQRVGGVVSTRRRDRGSGTSMPRAPRPRCWPRPGSSAGRCGRQRSPARHVKIESRAARGPGGRRNLSEDNMRNRIGMVVVVALISFFTGGWLMQQGIASAGGGYHGRADCSTT